MKKNLVFICITLIISHFSLAQKAGTIDNSFSSNVVREEVLVDNEGKIYARVGNLISRHLQNGAIDASFNGGYLLISSSHTLKKMAIQNDNKVILLGRHDVYDQISVHRYNQDGTLDNTFGGGIVFLPSSSDASSIYIQNDGKILVGGRKNSSSGFFRINTNGSLDFSFGTNGEYITNTTGYIDAIFVHNNGKILIIGNETITFATYLIQLSSDGILEHHIYLPLPFPFLLYKSRGLTVQEDNKILVNGLIYENFVEKLCITRLNPDLTIDVSFGTNGLVKRSEIAGTSTIKVQFDKKIIVNTNTSILRFDTNGNLDPSFGTNGVYASGASGLTLQKDGKIVFTNGIPKRLHGVSSFESNRGKMITQVGSGNDVAKSIAQRPNGKWVVAGSASPYFGLVGYNADGSLDYNFGSNAIVTTDFQPNTNAYGYSTVVQPDGKILVGGYANGTETYFALARYQTNGVLDNTFGTGGKVTNWINNQNGGIYKIALQTDGKIVAVGWNISNDFTVVRYNPNGTLDNTFGTNGVVTTDILGSSYDSAIDVFIRTDGKIVVAGNAENANGSQFAVVRYNSNGSLDTSFDSDGKFTTTVGGIYDYLYGMAVQTDGKIVLVGTASNGSNNNCGIVRVLENGGLDASFDGDGKRTFSIGGAGYDDYLTSVTMKADGKILLGGNFVSPTTNSTVFFSLLNSNGSFDTNFDSDGIYTTRIGYKDEEIFAVKYSTDGKIIAAGSYHNGTNTDFSLLAISPCAISNEFITTNYNSGTNIIEGKYITATNQVNSPANVSYKAANSVFLNSGFTANTGAVFKAEILPSCFY